MFASRGGFNMKKGIYVVIITLILAVFTLSACSFFSNEPVEYTITFFSDGGSSCEPIKISEDETKITLPKPVKVGYVFVGWYMDETYNVTIEEYLKDNGIDKDLRVYAKWVLADSEESKITFSLDVNGGDALLEDEETITFVINTTPQLPIPKRAGYRFVGWWTEKVDGEQITGANGLALEAQKGGNATLYARWEIANYVVTIEQNSFNAGNATADKDSYVYNETATLTATTNANYNFLGWYDTNDTLISADAVYECKIQDDLIIYAKWQGVASTLKAYYNRNESDEEFFNTEVYYGDSFKLNPPIRHGYSFIGWYSDRDGSGTCYTNASGVFNNYSTTEDRSVYAVWEIATANTEFNYSISNDETYVTVLSYKGSSNELYIPSTINDIPVTHIADNAFAHVDADKIIIPYSITNIGSGAFDNTNAKIYFDRGAKLSLITPTNFTDSQEIYAHATNLEYNESTKANYLPGGENALIDDYYVYFMDIYADTTANSVDEFLAFEGYMYLFNDVKQYVIKNETGYTYNQLTAKGTGLLTNRFNAEVSSQYRSNIKSGYVIHSLGDEITFEFELRNSNLIASDTTTNPEQIQAKAMPIYTELTPGEHLLPIDRNPEYPVCTSEQLVYAVENGFRPSFPVAGTVAEVIYKEAVSVLNSIINDEMNDLQKITAIHDWIVTNVVYDTNLLDLATPPDAVTTEELIKYKGFYLEGALLEKKAVCDGKTKLFTLLAGIEGYETVRVTGVLRDPETSKTENHAWSKIKLNGKWYIVDITNDDHTQSILGKAQKYEVLSRKYFLVSDEATADTHIEDDPTKYPDATENYANVMKNTYYAEGKDLYITTKGELQELFTAFKAQIDAGDAGMMYVLEFELVGYVATQTDINKIGYSHAHQTYGTNGHLYYVIK